MIISLLSDMKLNDRIIDVCGAHRPLPLRRPTCMSRGIMFPLMSQHLQRSGTETARGGGVHGKTNREERESRTTPDPDSSAVLANSLVVGLMKR